MLWIFLTGVFVENRSFFMDSLAAASLRTTLQSTQRIKNWISVAGEQSLRMRLRPLSFINMLNDSGTSDASLPNTAFVGACMVHIKTSKLCTFYMYPHIAQIFLMSDEILFDGVVSCLLKLKTCCLKRFEDKLLRR